MNYKKYYNLEDYLFGEVKESFRKNGFLTAEEFFCIVIWKANSAKSKHAKRLIKIAKSKKYSKLDLDSIVETLTKELKEKPKEKRLEYLIKEWKFLLPTASAILTVLYPDFTVYDVRVCDELENDKKGFFHKLNWKNYEKFVNAVKAKVSDEEALSLRDKDRLLWGKSRTEDLKKFIADWIKN